MNVLVAVGIIVFVVYAVFNILYILSLTKTIAAVREFFRETERNVNATLLEVRGIVENIRKISADAREVSAEVRNMASLVGILKAGPGKDASHSPGSAEQGVVKKPTAPGKKKPVSGRSTAAKRGFPPEPDPFERDKPVTGTL